MKFLTFRKARSEGARSEERGAICRRVALSPSRPIALLFSLIPFLILAGCALQPVSEPRRVDWSGEPTPLPTLEAVSKPTVVVEQGYVAEQLILTGRVGSAVEEPLEASKGGIVTAVFIVNGASVIEGDILATLDSSEVDDVLAQVRFELVTTEARLNGLIAGLETERLQAELAVERAEAQLALAQDRLSDPPTAAELSEIRILEIDVELAQLGLDQVDLTVDPILQGQVDDLRVRVAELEAEQASFVLKAPVDGDIANLNLNMGGRIREGDSLGLVINRDALVVWGDVVESELDLLQEGMAVQLFDPFDEDRSIGGVIALLPFPYGNGEFDVRETAVQITPDDPNFLEGLSLGERINITITLKENEDAVWLPPAALREFGGQSFVIVQEPDGNRRIDIEIGIVGNGRVEIVEGLEPGMVVEAP
ncbi:MAG: efflux RND transporter periplasmic adaptor subunit [Chloroflexota bacterium]